MGTAILVGIILTIVLQTGAASLPPPPVVDRAAEQPAMMPQDGADRLDGRMLIVRMYRDWENAPGEFERVSVRFQGNQAAMEPNEAPVPPVAVVVAEDQEDKVVKETVGDYIWVQSLTKEFALQLPFSHGPDREARFWMFTDALGEPLVQATTEIWITGPRGHPRIRFGRTTLDDAGGLTWKRLVGNLGALCFAVSHPQYGCAEVREPFESARRLAVPLVRKGTPAAERGIHGRIVDPNGEPVAGATIECRSVRTLGEGAIAGLSEPGKGIADANGMFSFYLPNRQGREDQYARFSFSAPTHQLIPPKSRYAVRIDTPKALGLLPYAGLIENGREARIVLERGDRLRWLRFEDRNGEITDPAQLEAITVHRQHDGNVLRFSYNDWKDGILLPPGTYYATTYGPHGRHDFAAVELTSQSPETVVFRLPARVTYRGRVVHGITGQPMPGAFVMAMNSASADTWLCELTAEQWDAMHQLARDPSENDVALDPLRKVYGFTKLVRTDATGTYAIAPEPDVAFYGLVAFEQNYLAAKCRRDSCNAGSDHRAEVATLQLFPAATVLVETVVDRQFLSILPRWEMDEGSQPAWVEQLRSIANDREGFPEYNVWLKSNAVQPVRVPAGVLLRLKLDLSSDEEFCPILIPQTICLGQGEVADLGCFTFEPALAVQVRVIDSAGQPLEGIPIRTMQADRKGNEYWNTPHNTDEQGLARFHVVPHSTGTFGILHYGDDGVPLKQTLDYQVAGPEDAGREFVLQLSDKMLAHLLQ